MIQHRQGDLLFVRQEALPVDTALKQRPTNVILEGETTGHAHRLAAGAVLDAPDGQIWLEVKAPKTQVVHEEHGPITLDQGAWLVVRQREYAPEAPRVVID